MLLASQMWYFGDVSFLNIWSLQTIFWGQIWHEDNMKFLFMVFDLLQQLIDELQSSPSVHILYFLNYQCSVNI